MLAWAGRNGPSILLSIVKDIPSYAKEMLSENRKRSMMTAIRKDPANLVTERDKAKDPISWAGRMANFQHRVHETIYEDLIYS